MGDIWRAPERGVLAGRILVVNNQDSFTLSDPMQQEWQVMVVPPPPRIGAPVRPLIAPKLQPLEAGVRVIMRGVRVGEREFNAFEVRPWKRGEF